MSTEQVRIDLEANDKASKTIDHVADAAGELEKLDPEVEISADDKASKTIGAVDAAAMSLDKLDPEIHITADDDASKKIRDVDDDARQLTAADRELILKARIDDARAGLKLLRDDLEQTADKAQQTERRMDDIGRTSGPGLAGNAVADLTGPLGEASSAASDIAGVFDGLGDIAGSAAARVGLSAEQMAGAITGIGFAVTAAATAWAYFRQRQEAARQRQAELVKGQRDLNDAIAEGDRAAAASKLIELYEDAFAAADKAGVSANELTKFLTGQTKALPALEAELMRVNDEIERNGGAVDAANVSLVAYRDDLEDLRGRLRGARNDYNAANGSIAEQDRRLGDVAGALDVAAKRTDQMGTASERAARKIDQTSAALDRLRGDLDIEQAAIDFERAFTAAVDQSGQSALDAQADVLAMKQTVIDTGEALKQNPLEIQTVLDKVAAGDLVGAYNDVQTWFDERPVYVTVGIKPQRIGYTPIGGGQIVIDSMAATAAGPSIGTVNMMLPAGWRGDPIRTAHAQRRRSGRYYSRLG